MTIKELMEKQWQRKGCEHPIYFCRWRVYSFEELLLSERGTKYEVPKRPARKKRE